MRVRIGITIVCLALAACANSEPADRSADGDSVAPAETAPALPGTRAIERTRQTVDAVEARRPDPDTIIE